MMKCEIIRDLIPLYLDKVCSEDSRKLVEEHLAECSECRKYMKELETELEAVKQKKEEDLDEKRLLQEGAERMKEIGRKSIVDKMIIVDTLLNFLLIVTAVVLCKRQIDIEGADAGYYIAAWYSALDLLSHSSYVTASHWFRNGREEKCRWNGSINRFRSVKVMRRYL